MANILPQGVNSQAVFLPDTIGRALILCGVDRDSNNIICNGTTTTTARITNEVFTDWFQTCMGITFSELDDTWNTYSQLTVGNGRIRICPVTNSNIKAMVQWARDWQRIGMSTVTNIFPINDKANLLERYHNHKQWLKDAPQIIKTLIRFNVLDFFDNPTRDDDIHFEANESICILMQFKGRN